MVMGWNRNQWKCGVEWGQRSRDQRSEVTGVRRAGGSKVKRVKEVKGKGYGTKDGDGVEWEPGVIGGGEGSEVTGSKVRGHRGEKGQGGQGSRVVRGVNGGQRERLWGGGW